MMLEVAEQCSWGVTKIAFQGGFEGVLGWFIEGRIAAAEELDSVIYAICNPIFAPVGAGGESDASDSNVGKVFDERRASFAFAEDINGVGASSGVGASIDYYVAVIG